MTDIYIQFLYARITDYMETHPMAEDHEQDMWDQPKCKIDPSCHRVEPLNVLLLVLQSLDEQLLHQHGLYGNPQDRNHRSNHIPICTPSNKWLCNNNCERIEI